MAAGTPALALVHGGINTLLCQLTISGSSQVSHTRTGLHGSFLILVSTRAARSPEGLGAQGGLYRPICKVDWIVEGLGKSLPVDTKPNH